MIFAFVGKNKDFKVKLDLVLWELEYETRACKKGYCYHAN
jgi:hypothetical protein